MKRVVIWLVLGLACWAGPAWARQGRWCVSCHLEPPPRTLGELSWQAPVPQAMISPCHAIRRAKLELALLEGRLVRLQALVERKPELSRRWEELVTRYRLALEQPLYSLGDIERILGGLRAELYERVQRPWQGRRRRVREVRLGVGLVLWLMLVGLGVLEALRQRVAPRRESGRLEKVARGEWDL